MSDLRLLLLGNLGCGKTSSADTILGQLAPISPTASRSCQLRQGLSDGRDVTLVEAPRWYWSGGRMEEGVRRETARSMTLVTPGPHAILLLVPVSQFTEVECCVPAELEELFGEETLNHTLVLLTCGDYLMGKTPEQYLQKEHPGLRQIIDRCGGRYHVFNNRQRLDREQVRTLLQKVDNMVKENGVFHALTAQERDLEMEVRRRQQEILARYGYPPEDTSMHVTTETRRTIVRQMVINSSVESCGGESEGDVYVTQVSNGRLTRPTAEREPPSPPRGDNPYSPPRGDNPSSPPRGDNPSRGFRLSSDGALLSQMSQESLSPKLVTTFHHRINSFEEKSPETPPTSTRFPAFSSSTYSSTSSSDLPSSYSTSSSTLPSSYSTSSSDLPSSYSTSSYSSSSYSTSSSALPSSDLPSSYSTSSSTLPSSYSTSSSTLPSSYSTSSSTLPSSYSTTSSDLPSSYSTSSSTLPSSYSTSSSTLPSSYSTSSSTLPSSYSTSSYSTSSSALPSSNSTSSSTLPSSYSTSSSTLPSSTLPSSYSTSSYSTSSSALPSSYSTSSSSSTLPSSYSTSSSTLPSSYSTSSSSTKAPVSPTSSSSFSTSYSTVSSTHASPSETSSFRTSACTTSPSSTSSFAELRLVLLGRSGSGKSAAGNTILGREEFQSHEDSLTAVTQECEKKKAVVEGKRVAVVDTPDWFNSEHSPDEVRAQISSCVALASPGPHAFLMCVPLDQPAKTELQALRAVETVFGPEAVQNHTLVLFTYADKLRESGKVENDDVEAYIANQRADLLNLVEKCRDRYHVLEDKERRNVAELLEKVEQTVEEVGGRCYSSPAFQEAEDRVRQKQLEIVRASRGRKPEQDGGQSSSERQVAYPYMQTVAEAEEDVGEDEIERTRDEAERSVRSMNIESLPPITLSSLSPSLFNSIMEKMRSAYQMMPELWAGSSAWVSDGAQKVRSSPMWGKMGGGAQNVQKMVSDSALWEKAGASARQASKLVGDRVPQSVVDKATWVQSGAKAAAQSPVWGKMGSGAKVVAGKSMQVGAGIGTGAKNLAQNPMWGKVGEGAKSGAKLVADSSVRVGTGISTGAKKVAQSPVWGKMGSGAKAGAKMVAESPVWEKVSSGAKSGAKMVAECPLWEKVGKVAKQYWWVLACALLGLLLGVMIAGFVGGVVGAAVAAGAAEFARRKVGDEKINEAAEGLVKRVSDAVGPLLKRGEKTLKTE